MKIEFSHDLPANYKSAEEREQGENALVFSGKVYDFFADNILTGKIRRADGG
jgi:hypothetical protein